MSDIQQNLTVEYVSVGDLVPYERNARKHADEDISAIVASIRQFGFLDPIGVWKGNLIVEGHGRLEAAKRLGMDTVPIIRLDHLTDEERRAYALAHNRTAELSNWDFVVRDEELSQISEIDMSAFGFDLQDGFDDSLNSGVSLAERFIVPPFSVLDTRQGYWKERKKGWRDKIGDLGQARDVMPNTFAEYYGGMNLNDASLLDPVLSELVCQWFGIPGGRCFDTFAGDTVFGYVSASMGMTFTGIELREEQATFNAKQTEGLPATYICDDGRNVLRHIAEESQDLYFSCPPYYDLEVYSDKPEDASNQETYEEFYAILDAAFRDAVRCLKDDRFAVVVCGDVRDKRRGTYYGFPDDIKRTFIESGCALYNELILVDPIGTARLRAKRSMRTRKVTKVHQNVLVFYKGDTRKISNTFPDLGEDYDREDMEF